jgi:selenocysteine lyase/cysteine desulfurase
MLSPTDLARAVSSAPVATLAGDEDFWSSVRALYDCDPAFAQLNYGFYHPSMTPVLEAELTAAREVNRRGSQFKRFESPVLLEAVRAEVASLIGAGADEVVITRSASEALNLVLGGLQLRAGDEVVCGDQDYTAAVQALEQRVRYDGIVVRKVAVPLHPRDDAEILAAYEAALGPQTRFLLVTHLLHVSGQILPVDALCALARERGVAVMVDSAHALGQVALDVDSLGCDYLSAALHKWVGSPLGTGLLYVKRGRAAALKPLFGDTVFADTDVRRLERFGNRSDAALVGLSEALRWHQALGADLKRERLSLLRRRWQHPLSSLPRVHVHTPESDSRCAAIGVFSVDGLDAETLSERLYRHHGLYTAIQKLPSVTGVRIVPGLPTPLEHLDRLVAAVRKELGANIQP